MYDERVLVHVMIHVFLNICAGKRTILFIKVSKTPKYTNVTVTSTSFSFAECSRVKKKH